MENFFNHCVDVVSKSNEHCVSDRQLCEECNEDEHDKRVDNVIVCLENNERSDNFSLELIGTINV